MKKLIGSPLGGDFIVMCEKGTGKVLGGEVIREGERPAQEASLPKYYPADAVMRRAELEGRELIFAS